MAVVTVDRSGQAPFARLRGRAENGWMLQLDRPDNGRLRSLHRASHRRYAAAHSSARTGWFVSGWVAAWPSTEVPVPLPAISRRSAVSRWLVED
jgi:hypothetical protein